MRRISGFAALDARGPFGIHGFLCVALVVAAAAVASFASAADRPALLEPGHRMPPLRGELLSRRRFALPDSLPGTRQVLLLGFTYESRHDVERWAARLKAEFGRDTSFACFEVPVIGGAARLARPFIDGGMRRGTPRELHERVMTVYGGAAEWKARAGVVDDAMAYVLLIGSDGHVAWRGAGPFCEESWRVLAAAMRSLAK